jgi:hypothetical protein
VAAMTVPARKAAAPIVTAGAAAPEPPTPLAGAKGKTSGRSGQAPAA